ncbi:MAG TPA: BON domain-containing protein [Paraburkholderia sp.]|jgi:hyperosmotically inducible protein|nr:BON domain-containing protein [Paraburkholderia sp.]
MDRNGASKRIGAMLAAVVASWASGANAQTQQRAPADASVQKVAAAGRQPGTRPDTSIIRDVRRALRRVPELDDSDIHIRASVGVVTLTGSVPESWQISRAGNAARSVHGVRSVSNRLTTHEDDNGH